eukprot:CAMPEP_0119140470 /NCGR_PEP_ID=MMETSP1310-20130426/29270_1 /TAXON_ID=464262 /ORGANISM="Genus nov. species nov., Strain RCC2339" /LENGTH=74 /DNA_ID=CAMNT_0007131827 /DNA_START=20 /DNA_END=241 /DNA_ORIENTATION=-
MVHLYFDNSGQPVSSENPTLSWFDSTQLKKYVGFVFRIQGGAVEHRLDGAKLNAVEPEYPGHFLNGRTHVGWVV